MEKLLVVGGSKGIGSAIVKLSLEHKRIINFSRTTPQFTHHNLSNYNIDVLNDDLPEIEALDQLVYCLGTINLKPFNRLSKEDFLNDFEVNVLGAVKVLQKYISLLEKSSSGSVVLFSSVATKMGMPFHASVAASKSAIEGITRTLAAEYATKIRVNCIAPTLTETPLAAKILRNDKMKEMMNARHPFKTYLQPSDIASMANHLLSNESHIISGQTITIDAGITSVKL